MFRDFCQETPHRRRGQWGEMGWPLARAADVQLDSNRFFPSCRSEIHHSRGNGGIYVGIEAPYAPPMQCATGRRYQRRVVVFCLSDRYSARRNRSFRMVRSDHALQGRMAFVGVHPTQLRASPLMIGTISIRGRCVCVDVETYALHASMLRTIFWSVYGDVWRLHGLKPTPIRSWTWNHIGLRSGALLF